jgi:hypothetical protein
VIFISGKQKYFCKWGWTHTWEKHQTDLPVGQMIVGNPRYLNLLAASFDIRIVTD